MDERVQEKKSTIAHSLAKEVDCQDKNMEKKLSKKRKKSASEDNTNGGDHSILTEEEQNKKTKTEKMLSKENKRSEDREYEPIKELAKHNEREGDDGGKKKKTKKKHKEYNDSKSNERKKSASDDHTNGGDHSILTEEEQSKKKKKTEKMLSKKNKISEDGEYETIEELAKHNESGDDEGDKKKKKKKKKKHKEYNDSNNNESRDDDGGKKKKKKKKHKEYNDSKSNECEDDGQVKKMEKKQLTEQSKLQEYDDTVEKTKTEKNLSKKNKQSGDEEHETNGGNPFLVKNNEREDDDQGKKLKKKKLSDESKHKEDNKFRNNVGEDADQGKKMKKKMKKKLSDESKHKEDNDFRNNVDEDGDIGKKKKKKKQSHKSKKNENCVLNSNEGEDGDQGNGGDQGENMKKRKKAKAVVGDSSNPADERASKRKRVTFSDQVEVCCDGLVRGKRFTPEEDEKIKSSVYDYIESKGLGDEGLDMVLNSRKHREVRGCWKEIAEVIPYRPWYSVYHRAHVLFETVDSKWTPDELDFIRKAQGHHGSDWKSIAEALGRGRHQVKDAWRNVKFTNAKRGNWSQEEYQNLFNLVNSDLRARALEDFRKVQHGMFRDNVSWESVGTKLSTRSSAMCCMKWYNKLTSPMVASGEWCDTDDFRMINALYTLDACCMEEVDWDYLLEHRSGDVCRKRWGQMVQHIGEHAGKSFAEQVEILAKRFCPELLEAREAFDNKPVEEGVLKGQELENAVSDANYSKAIQIAFELRRPHRLLALFSELCRKKGGQDHIDTAIKVFGNEELRLLFNYIREWNSKPKLCYVSQFMLYRVFNIFPPTDIVQIKGVGELLEGLIPYSQRHFGRIDRLVRSTFLLDYILSGISVIEPESQQMDSKAGFPLQSKMDVPDKENGKEEKDNNTASKKRKSNKSRPGSHKKVKDVAYNKVESIQLQA